MVRNFDSDNFVDRLKSNCRLIEIKEFQADEIITTLLSKRNQFCILLEGKAQLLTYDKDGNKKILYYYTKNDVFGEPLFKILKNLPDLVFASIAKQNFRMLLLTNKSVRDKLLTYFQILASESRSKTFELPMSLTDLSDYLMIERTAMMREIKRLKDEKIIKKNKNKITLS